MTEPEPLQTVDRTYVRYRNRRLSSFSGCDYFRLASHPAVLKAARAAVRKFGLNVAASRLTTGNHQVYQALEGQLAKFFAAEDALLGRPWTRESVAAVASLVAQAGTPMSDHRGSAAYRAAMSVRLLEKFHAETTLGRRIGPQPPAVQLQEVTP